MGNKTKILADGNCIVCDLEVSHYKKLAPDIFDVVDISQPDFDAAKYGLTAEAVNKHMHVLTPNGEIKIGVDAFAHIWNQFERYKIASRLIKLPIINPIAKAGYLAFATIRPYLPKKKR